MGVNRTYPDGSVLTSTALTLEAINTILVTLTQGMLGQTPDPESSLVRVQWPTEGAPFQDINDDICYLRCVPVDSPYDRIRDRVNVPNNDETLEEIWTYTRAWKIQWCMYGPNSLDNARAIRSALYQDYFTQLLADSQLFPVSDFPETMRVPELMNAQWFERVDLEVEFYEFITETIDRQTILSSENIIEGDAGEIADFTVTVT